MRHRRKGVVLGREKAPRTALLRSLATSLILYEKIRTTQAKAKAVQSVAEKLVTIAKEDSLHNKRKTLKVVYTEGAMRKLFEVLGPRFKERPGGYTRITKLGRRPGDAAEMALIEFVD